MAIIRAKKMKEMSEKDVAENMSELKLELSKDRASSEIGTVKNPGRIRELRRSIARLMHEQNRRVIAARNPVKIKKAAPVAKPAAAKAVTKGVAKK